MQWIVRKSHLAGTITAPPSKSHTIRALLIASLAQGVSTVRNTLVDGDGGSALRVAAALGARVMQEGSTVRIDGQGGIAADAVIACDCGNSGTSTTLFTSAAALGRVAVTFDGDLSLRSRPMGPLFEALRQLGVTIWVQEQRRDLPFTVMGPITGGPVTVNGVSSQFVSSLLLSCPLASGTTELSVVNLQERPYVEITLWWLRKMGIAFEHNDSLTHFVIPGAQRYHPIDLSIPGDFSSATFAAVAAAVGNTTIGIDGIDFTDPQGDKGVFTILEQFGAGVERGASGAVVSGRGKLTGHIIDLNAMPDALPALCVAACAAEGETCFVNVGQARIKETDRIQVMCRELSKMGARISELPDGLVVQGGQLRGAAVSGHNDHRVVMALALAGMIADGETHIDTAEAASVTYPGFLQDFKALGADISVCG